MAHSLHIRHWTGSTLDITHSLFEGASSKERKKCCKGRAQTPVGPKWFSPPGVAFSTTQRSKFLGESFTYDQVIGLFSEGSSSWNFPSRWPLKPKASFQLPILVICPLWESGTSMNVICSMSFKGLPGPLLVITVTEVLMSHYYIFILFPIPLFCWQFQHALGLEFLNRYPLDATGSPLIPCRQENITPKQAKTSHSLPFKSGRLNISSEALRCCSL